MTSKMAEEHVDGLAVAPYAGIQWKGTDVCMDVHCLCGGDMHVDGYFAHYVECKDCGMAYYVSNVVQLLPVAHTEAFEPLVGV